MRFTIRIWPFRLWIAGGYSLCKGYGGYDKDGKIILTGISRHLYLGYCRDLDKRGWLPFCTAYFIHGEDV